LRLLHRGAGPLESTLAHPPEGGLDFLNDRLAQIFEEHGAAFLKDPWAARNDYLEIILDRREETVARFLSRHGVRELHSGEWFEPLRLLEMQRHTLLMYTSCGWFFADISGLETVQVLKYAARAMQLGQRLTREPLEEPFLNILENAQSNIAAEGNGRDIFLRRVKPLVGDFPKVVNQWAITWLKNRERLCPHCIYHFRVRPQEHEIRTQGTLELAAGRLDITSGVTWKEETLSFFTVHLGSYLYRTQISSNSTPEAYQALKEELFRVLAETPEDLMPFLAARLGERYYTVHDIFQEEKEQLFLDLLEQNREEALGTLAHHFGDAKPVLRAMASDGLLIPRLYQALGEITLNRRLVQILRRLEPDPELLPASEDLLHLLEEAELFGFKLESGEGAQILQRILHHHLAGLAAGFQVNAAQDLMNFLNVQQRIPITMDLTEAQNFFFGLLKEHFPALAARSARHPEDRDLAAILVDLAAALNFDPEPYQRLLS
jgi:hypothetical protein